LVYPALANIIVLRHYAGVEFGIIRGLSPDEHLLKDQLYARGKF